MSNGPRPLSHAVVPMKALSRAKSRLARALAPEARRELARTMLGHVLGTLLACRSLHGGPLAQIWVVSHDHEVLELATLLGASPLRETVIDLNTALEEARSAAFAHGAQRLLVLPGDVPLLTGEDIVAMLDLLEEDVDLVIAPDTTSEGTNALAMRLPSPLRFQFGSASFAQHSRAAQSHGLRLARYGSATVALDIDTPANYEDFARRGAPSG